MTTTEVHEATAWPMARRAIAGLVQPGGPAMVARAVEGLGLGGADRLVQLAPGVGGSTEVLLAAGPRSWVGVEPDPLAAAHLRRAFDGPGREVREAPLDATGLPDGEASAVLAEGVLGTLEAAGRAAVLAECARLVRSGGRVALIDLVPADADGLGAEARAGLAAAGLHPTGVDGWRAALEAAGLVVVGAVTGPLALTAPPALMRDAGPRTALRLTRATALDGPARAGGTAARDALVRWELSLRAAVVVAEAPLVLGMRRPRRSA